MAEDIESLIGQIATYKRWMANSMRVIELIQIRHGCLTELYKERTEERKRNEKKEKTASNKRRKKADIKTCVNASPRC